MIKKFFCFMLLFFSSWDYARGATVPLYTHCAAQWSAQAVGETMCGWAVQHGFPPVAPEKERSCAKAYALGVEYFRFLSPTPGIDTAVLCAIFAKQGPTIFDRW